MRLLWLSGILTGLLSPALLHAGPLPKLDRGAVTASAMSFLTGSSPDALSGAFRGFLATNLPATLFEESPGWGHQTMVANGVTWKGKGLRVHPEIQHTLKNDGVWRKVRVVAPTLRDTLVFDLRNIRQPEPGRLTFDVFVSFDIRVELDQQTWESGVRLYSGSSIARTRVKLNLQCEATTRLEKNGKLLPDAVFRLHVTDAKVGYDNFHLEHVSGIGGTLAELVGDTVKGGLKKWHPSLERELLAKAEAAIVKAGDTKEVRVTLGNLVSKVGK